ncbi:MAG: hypothetical protein ACI9ON_004185 [Limisphaerales bacterium]|jgi:hypothetical protein
MISTKFLDNIQVAVHLASGEVDLEQFTNAASNWREHEDFSPQASVVYDLVAADISLNWEQAKQELPVCLEQLKNSRDPSSKTAWVVNEDVMNVVVDSVHMALPWTTEWRVFKDADEAVAWVISKPNP